MLDISSQVEKVFLCLSRKLFAKTVSTSYFRSCIRLLPELPVYGNLKPTSDKLFKKGKLSFQSFQHSSVHSTDAP